MADAAWFRPLRRWFWKLSTSRTNYRWSYAIDAASPIVLTYFGGREPTNWLTALAGVGAGWLTFTLIEYAIHRWLFHSEASFMTPIHQTHHDTPDAMTALPFFSAPGALFLLWLAFAWGLGGQMSCFVIAGIAAGYCWYSVLHHLEHSGWIQHPALRWLRKRYGVHVVHHRCGDRNYGVTTSLWDFVFGTHYLSRKRRGFHDATIGANLRSEHRADSLSPVRAAGCCDRMHLAEPAE